MHAGDVTGRECAARLRRLWPALLAALLACSGGKTEPAQSTSETSTEPQTWTLQQAHVYALELDSRYGAPGVDAIFDFELESGLELTAIAQSADSVELLVVLPKPALKARQNGKPVADLETILGDLRKPYAFTLRDGRFTEARIAPGLHPLALGVMRTLSGALQFSRGEGQRWEASESDATGRYVAAYERVDPRSVRRRKLRYESWNATHGSSGFEGAFPLPTIASSTLELRAAGAAPEQLQLNEQLNTELGRGAQLQSTTRLSLVRRSTRRAGDGPAHAALAGLVKLAANEPYSPPHSGADLDRAKIGGLSLSQIVSGLELQAKDSSKSGATAAKAALQPDPTDPVASDPAMAEQGRLFTALNATLRQDQSALKTVEATIRRGSPATATMISSLGAAGTAGGHALLLQLMDDKTLSEDVRNACGLSLARTSKPSSVAVAGVEARLDNPDWGRLAIYGLGTYARLLREAGNEAEAKRLFALLEARMRAATTTRTKVDALLGLSNSGAPELFAAVRPLTSDPRAELRGAAMTALRKVTDAEAQTILISALTSDSERRVRLAAVQALNKREPTPELAAALEQAALKDDFARVRYEAVRLMARWVTTSAAAHAALQKVARSDQEPAIQLIALSALGKRPANDGVR